MAAKRATLGKEPPCPLRKGTLPGRISFFPSFATVVATDSKPIVTLVVFEGLSGGLSSDGVSTTPGDCRCSSARSAMLSAAGFEISVLGGAPLLMGAPALSPLLDIAAACFLSHFGDVAAPSCLLCTDGVSKDSSSMFSLYRPLHASQTRMYSHQHLQEKTHTGEKKPAQY